MNVKVSATRLRERTGRPGLIARSVVRAQAAIVVLALVPGLSLRIASGAEPGERGGPAASAQSFGSHCGRCHGLDGRGGEHGPNIATDPAITRLGQNDLERIVRDGLPERGMPSFRALGTIEIKVLVGYLRSLQGKHAPGDVEGNPDRGKQMFFGAGQCSSCHMVRGNGGFLGPDLTEYASGHTPAEIRESIVKPGKNREARSEKVTATTRDGSTFTGVLRNEDNFSLQMQTPDGRFHLLMKSSLTSLGRGPGSLMPDDYGARLSKTDLDDLTSFLVRRGCGTSDRCQAGGESSSR